MEEDEANFDPEHDIRDYEEVAKALKVFCVSARAYQKLSGRLKRDGDVAGFQEKDETEVCTFVPFSRIIAYYLFHRSHSFRLTARN